MQPLYLFNLHANVVRDDWAGGRGLHAGFSDEKYMLSSVAFTASLVPTTPVLGAWRGSRAGVSSTPLMSIVDDIFKKNPFDDDAKKPLSSGDKPWCAQLLNHMHMYMYMCVHAHFPSCCLPRYMPEKEEVGEYWKPGDDASWKGAFDGFLQGFNYNAQLAKEREAERAAAAESGEQQDEVAEFRLPRGLRAAANQLAVLVVAGALTIAPLTALPAFAENKRVIGEVQTSGLVFKDTLRVEAFNDPKVQGVQLYLSDFQRPVTEKLAKGDVFSDPSQGGLTCSRAGKVVVTSAASRSLDGEEVFSESRSLVFKSLKVRRLVDKEGQNVVYAVYSQRLDKNEDANNSRFKSNLCAVHVDEFQEATAK